MGRVSYSSTSYQNKVVKLQSCDGKQFTVDTDIISMCATVKNMLRGKSVFRNALGGQFSIDGAYVLLKKEGRVIASLSKNDDEEAILTLPDVKGETLDKLMEYCKYHSTSQATEKEKKIWDNQFVQVKQGLLCELASASYFLDIKSLVNLTSKAIATQISAKPSTEIQETFCNLNCDVYAPVFATRCRLQRKFISKQKKLEDTKEATKESTRDDDRSLEELLEFIGDSENGKKIKKKTKKTRAKKKRHEKEKDKTINTPDSPPTELSDTAQRELEIQRDILFKKISSTLNGIFVSYTDEEIELLFGDESLSDDEIDPHTKAALDREVDDFRDRLDRIHRETTGPRIPFSMRVPALSLIMPVP